MHLGQGEQVMVLRVGIALRADDYLAEDSSDLLRLVDESGECQEFRV